MILSAPPNERLRLVFLGDSITVGDGDTAAMGWPARLCARTAPRPRLTQCYNLGIGGDRVSDVAARAVDELAVRLEGRTGCGVVLMIGVNDAILAASSADHAPLIEAEVKAHLHAILGATKPHGPVLVIQPAPVTPSFAHWGGGTGADVMAHVARINAWTLEIAETAGVPCVPLTDALSADPGFTAALGAGDELHPTDEGYDIIAAHIARSPFWSAFLEAVEKTIDV